MGPKKRSGSQNSWVPKNKVHFGAFSVFCMGNTLAPKPCVFGVMDVSSCPPAPAVWYRAGRLGLKEATLARDDCSHTFPSTKSHMGAFGTRMHASLASKGRSPIHELKSRTGASYARTLLGMSGGASARTSVVGEGQPLGATVILEQCPRFALPMDTYLHVHSVRWGRPSCSIAT